MSKKRKPLRIAQKPTDYIGKLCLIVVGHNYLGVTEHSFAHGSVYGGRFAEYVFLGEIISITFTDDGGTVEFDSVAAARGESQAMVGYWQRSDVGMITMPFAAKAKLLSRLSGESDITNCYVVPSQSRLRELLNKRVFQGKYLTDEFLPMFDAARLLQRAASN